MSKVDHNITFPLDLRLQLACEYLDLVRNEMFLSHVVIDIIIVYGDDSERVWCMMTSDETLISSLRQSRYGM